MEKFFLVGIKGTGMASLSQVLKDLGNFVIGSDVSEVFFTDEILKNKNITFYDFNTYPLDNTFTYIASSCYNEFNNNEIKVIKDNNYKFFYYHEFINNYFKGIKIGVSGSHGKTTSTSFIKQLFRDELTCSIIGDGIGESDINYKYLIFEACEYKDHLLTYSFDYLVINNIDLEHLDYFKSLDEIKLSFIKASKKAKVLVLNEDIDIIHPNTYTFGFKKTSFTHATILEETESGYLLSITIDSKNIIYKFNHQGIHMIKNLLASITVYYLETKKLNLVDFYRPKRRMEEYFNKTNIYIDDYAHHPTEIKALLKSVKQKYPNKIIITLFQPHTYSRTLSLKEEFSSCFEDVDILYLEKTFTSKRENYDLEKEKLIQDIFKNAHTFTSNTIENLKKKENCVIIFLGAGVIRKHIQTLLKN